MNTYLQNLWDSLRASFWFIPAILASLAIIGSFLLPAIDHRIPEEYLSWCATTTPAARTTLSTIAAALMTVTGTVFSITVVTLSLTSQQFGPRLLRSFMHDMLTQITMGMFLSTGVYCLLVLRIVEDREAVAVPHLSVASAVGMTVVNMGLLIFFFHHVSQMIQAPKIVASVADDLDDSIQRLFPEPIGEGQTEQDEQPQVDAFLEHLGDDVIRVRACGEGYIQAVDGEGLLEFARCHDVCLQLLRRPGHYVSRGDELARLWLLSDADAESRADVDRAGDCESDAIEKTSEQWDRRLADFVIVGSRRTPRQDVECAVDELVEVAVRSLSPGINDPFTAINCIDRLRSTLGRLAERRTPRALRRDEAQQVRVIAPVVTFPDVMDAAFNAIRQYATDSPVVMIRMLEAFRSIQQHVSRDEDHQAILAHAQKVLRAAEQGVDEESDLEVVRQRYATIAEASDASID